MNLLRPTNPKWREGCNPYNFSATTPSFSFLILRTFLGPAFNPSEGFNVWYSMSTFHCRTQSLTFIIFVFSLQALGLQPVTPPDVVQLIFHHFQRKINRQITTCGGDPHGGGVCVLSLIHISIREWILDNWRKWQEKTSSIWDLVLQKNTQDKLKGEDNEWGSL